MSNDPTAATAAPCVLLVEDDPAQRQLFVEAVRRWRRPVAVVEAPDVAGALDHLGRVARDEVVAPDLVFLDWMMPTQSGMTVLGMIRLQMRFCDTPVVMFTGLAGPVAMECAQSLGANGYIVKPDRFADYICAVHAVLDWWLADQTPVGSRVAGPPGALRSPLSGRA